MPPCRRLEGACPVVGQGASRLRVFCCEHEDADKPFQQIRFGYGLSVFVWIANHVEHILFGWR